MIIIIHVEIIKNYIYNFFQTEEIINVEEISPPIFGTIILRFFSHVKLSCVTGKLSSKFYNANNHHVCRGEPVKIIINQMIKLLIYQVHYKIYLINDNVEY